MNIINFVLNEFKYFYDKEPKFDKYQIKCLNSCIITEKYANLHNISFNLENLEILGDKILSDLFTQYLFQKFKE
jgi:dsRNA-specific ribonuclease